MLRHLRDVLLLLEEVFSLLRNRDDKVKTSGVPGMLEASALKCVFMNETPRDPPLFHGFVNLFAAVVVDVGALTMARIWVERISLIGHFGLAWNPAFLMLLAKKRGKRTLHWLI